MMGDHQQEKSLNPSSPNGLLGPKRLCKPLGAFEHLFHIYFLPEWTTRIPVTSEQLAWENKVRQGAHVITQDTMANTREPAKADRR